MGRTFRTVTTWSAVLWGASIGLAACSGAEQPTLPALTPLGGSGATAAPAMSPNPSQTPDPGATMTPSHVPVAPQAPAAQAGSGAMTNAMPAANPMMSDASGEVSYHKDIRPIIEARCTMCHVAGGAMEKIPLDTWTALEPFKGLVVNAVKSRRMPPWLADDSDCTKLRGNQRLSDAQIALFTTWETKGFPAGTESEFKPLEEPPAPTVDTPPDMIIKARQPFQLNPGVEDYFCLATDASFKEDTWVYAMDLVPDNPEYVHHAIVNIGSTCSALGTLAENIYSYRPGSRTLVFEKGDAMLFRAGASIHIQFHYNTRYATRGQTLPKDHSAYRLWTLPAGQKPQRQIGRMPNHDLLINIPVGAVDQREGGSASISREFVGGEIIGISPHMHYLGQKFKETLHVGFDETCLIDIPDWDQDWQLDYFFKPEDYIKVPSGASVSQTCLFSNRPEDQGTDPTGKPFSPMYTTFGEDTRQEMCLGYIWFRTPLAGTGSAN